ncbi:MAG: glycerol-3-phosphate 1-O-acyltransferase PlsY [Phycisphaerales bacterium JB063]
MLIWTLWLAGAYLLGAIPFGLLIARAKGVDLRSKGSGNLGATNVGRVMGKPFGIACFVLDLGKGLLPVVTYRAFDITPDLVAGRGWLAALLWMAIGVAAVLGHIFPVWLKFKGGKGVATSLGALLGFYPVLTIPALASALIWFIVTKATAYVGLASVIAAIAMPLLAAGYGLATRQDLGETAVYVAVCAVLAGLVVVRHRGNLARLRAGTEDKVDWANKAKRAAK